MWNFIGMSICRSMVRICVAGGRSVANLAIDVALFRPDTVGDTSCESQ
jgi:hypothetical protein